MKKYYTTYKYKRFQSRHIIREFRQRLKSNNKRKFKIDCNYVASNRTGAFFIRT